MTEMWAKKAKKAKTTGLTKIGIGEKILSDSKQERSDGLKYWFFSRLVKKGRPYLFLK